MRTVFISLLITLVSAPVWAQTAKKKLLVIGEVKGYQHDSTSYGLGMLWKLGIESGVWDTFLRTDTQLITKTKLPDNGKNLDYFDAVAFYTTGELAMDQQQKADLLSFIREGKGFIGIHCAADTFYQWPEYGEMLGGYFDEHPWNQFQAPVIVEDREHPTTRHFPATFTIHDEIYQFKNFSRDRVRVLMSLDPNQTDLKNPKVKRTDRDFAVTWVRNYGKGRVFYSTLGHREDAWQRPDVQKMWVEAVKWVTGLTSGEATPRPRAK